MKGYDLIPANADMLLDLPFYEGTGTITRDQAKPHHQDVALVATPTWDTVGGTGLGVITLNGTTQYIELANADCADLDFTSGDYSIGMWFYWTVGQPTLMLAGRYQLDVSGWEFYLYDGGGADRILTLRHNHAGGVAARSACYSIDWSHDTWWFVGASRSGIAAVHYRNGIALTTTHGGGGLEDMETCAQDLVFGTRYSKDTNFFSGSIWRPRVWSRALTAIDWLNIYESERDLLGV